MTRLHRLKVKVTIQGQVIYPWIWCLLYISQTVWTSFIILHSNIPLRTTVCRIHDSATKTQGQGHSSCSKALPLNFVSAPYLLNPMKDFYKFFGQMLISLRQCAEPLTQLHRLWVKAHLEFLVCSISQEPLKNSIRFDQMLIWMSRYVEPSPSSVVPFPLQPNVTHKWLFTCSGGL